MSVTRYVLQHTRDKTFIADVIHTRNGAEVLYVAAPDQAKPFDFMSMALAFLVTEELNPFDYEAKPISL